VSRALVLGGGGVTGIAWETGVLQGLAETGFDIAQWDMVVGTSAGAVVGAKLLGEPCFEAWFESQVHDDYAAEDDIVRALAGRVGSRLIFAARRPRLGWAPRLWLTATTVETFVRHSARRPRSRSRSAGGVIPREIVPPDPALAHLGALSLVARTASEERFLGVIANALAPLHDWPAGLVVTAIDAVDGSTVAFDASSGIDVVRGVAASAAVPLLFPPVVIGGHPYIDGGMASQTHADVAAAMDEVLVIAPIGGASIDAELEQVQTQGGRTAVIRPSDEATLALGRDLALLDPARRPAAARTGREDGLRAGRELVATRSWGRPSSAA